MSFVVAVATLNLDTAWKRLLLSAASGLIAIIFPVAAAVAGTVINELPVPTAGSTPDEITHGPDGNMWFVESTANKIGRVTPAHVFTEFNIPTAASAPSVLIQGPDGNLWFTEFNTNKIGRITTGGHFDEFPLPAGGTGPQFITVGPDGNLWFTERTSSRIGRITMNGTIADFATPTGASQPIRIISGPDGNLWFIEQMANKVGRITTSGHIDEFPIPTASSNPQQIVNGSDGNLWFNEQTGNKIGRIMPAGGHIDEFTVPTANSQPTRLVLGRDGNIWFTEQVSNKIGSITPVGNFTEFIVPTPGSQPNRINRGRDANLWFSENMGNKIVRMTYDGSSFTEFPLSTPNANINQITTGYDGNLWFVGQGSGIVGQIVDDAFNTFTLAAAVLPGSRSVKAGATATAFATIINAGATTAMACGINDNLSGLPFSQDPETFTYQTTDPHTNALTGSPNTQVNIPAGQSQSFLIAFATSGPFVPDDIRLNFGCSGVGSVPFIVGVNTLLLSASPNAVPDIIALGATATGNGILSLGGPNGANAFAVASANVGSPDSITFSADTGSANLPLVISVCQTNSMAQCIVGPGPSVTIPVAAGDTPTFSVFVSGTGTDIPSNAAINRIFARFKNSQSVISGETSVAVTTE